MFLNLLLTVLELGPFFVADIASDCRKQLLFVLEFMFMFFSYLYGCFQFFLVSIRFLSLFFYPVMPVCQGGVPDTSCVC